ncbi:MAG: hypothetical protein ACKVJH_05810 [Flavobacteriales bacterium]
MNSHPHELPCHAGQVMQGGLKDPNVEQNAEEVINSIHSSDFEVRVIVNFECVACKENEGSKRAFGSIAHKGLGK